MVADVVIKEEDKPTDDDLRKFDQDRKKQGKKTVSNEEWPVLYQRKVTLGLDAF